VLTFLGAPRSKHAEHAHESSPLMYGPLWVLAIASVVAAVLGFPALHGVPEKLQDVFGRYTEPVFEAAYEHLKAVGHLPAVAHEGLGPFVFAWVIAAIGTAIAWTMYAAGATQLPASLARAFPGTYRFAVEKFRVDELYEAMIIEPLRFIAYALWRIVDVFAIDGLFVNGIARMVGLIGAVVRLAQNGDVQRYAAIMAMAAAVILWSIVGVGGR
jgi:NADH-quinone oxidoreductase subunit L